MSLFGSGDEISDGTPMHYHENETIVRFDNNKLNSIIIIIIIVFS